MILFDTGALIAAERRNVRFAALQAELVANRITPLVPVVVLAQAWRGGPQAMLSRLLKSCEILPDTETIGRFAGLLCARSDTGDVVDAIVVATALVQGMTVVTSDPDDLSRLAGSVDRKLGLYVV